MSLSYEEYMKAKKRVERLSAAVNEERHANMNPPITKPILEEQGNDKHHDTKEDTITTSISTTSPRSPKKSPSSPSKPSKKEGYQSYDKSYSVVHEQMMEQLKEHILSLFTKYGLKYTVEASINELVGDISRHFSQTNYALQKKLSAAELYKIHNEDSLDNLRKEYEEKLRHQIESDAQRLRRQKALAKSSEKKALARQKEELEKEFAEKNTRGNRVEKFNTQKIKELEAEYMRKHKKEMKLKLEEQASIHEQEIAKKDGEASAFKQIIEKLKEHCTTANDQHRGLRLATQQYKNKLSELQHMCSEAMAKENELHEQIDTMKKEWDKERGMFSKEMSERQTECNVLNRELNMIQELMESERMKHERERKELENEHKKALCDINDRVKILIEKKDSQHNMLRSKYEQTRTNLAHMSQELIEYKTLMKATKMQLNEF